MKKNTFYIVIFFVTLFLSGQIALSQDDTVSAPNRNLRIRNPEGTEFWLCFEKNYRDTKNASDSLMLELFITGDLNTNVDIEIEGINFKTRVYVQGGTIKNVRIPSEAEVKSDEIIERLAIHITSERPVSVYGLNRRKQTTDTYLGFSTEVLGTEYRVMSYTVSDGLMPQFAIIGTEDSTTVNITPTTSTTKHPNGKPFKVLLRKGDVYQVIARDMMSNKIDITGTLITSNKKIAVFSGHQCAYVPPKEIACNHLVEQMPPISSWGKHFYIGKLQPRTSFTYRVLANEPQTRVFEDNKLVKILNEGEYFEATVRRNIQVTASKPVLVAQYSHGFKNGDMIGDPMMLLISPTQQFLQQYRFATPVNGFWEHYVNLVVPTKSIGSMKLDGYPVDSAHFEPLGISRYSIGFVRIPFGSHVIEGDLPFGMYSYGFGYDKDAFDAYGTMGGQSFMEYEPVKDTLAPMLEERPSPSMVNLIFRDDRVDDSGIKSYKILENTDLVISAPERIEDGLPQLSLIVKPAKADAEARLVIEVSDVAMNTSTYTVCYTFDNKADRFVFIVNEGNVSTCFPDPGYLFGAFGRLSINFHSSDFSSTGNIHTRGPFSEASGVSGYGGLSVTRFLMPEFALSGRLVFEKQSGILEAADSTVSFVRDANNNLISVQESRTLELTGLFISLQFAAEYYFEKYFYGLGGLGFSIPLSSGIEYNRNIIFPESYTYANDQQSMKEPEETLESLSSLGVDIFAGIGLSLQINYKLSVFAEGLFTHRLNSMINDGSWSLSKLTFQAGVRFRY